MTRPLDVPERQVRAIIRAAQKEGRTPEIIFGKTVVRLVPDIRDDRPQDERAIDDGGDIRL